MGPHECKLDANDSTAGSELKERKKKNTRYRRTANEKKAFSASAAVRYKLTERAAGWAEQTAEYFLFFFPFFLQNIF